MYNDERASLAFKRTILVVDDEEINRDILASFFENEFNILHAENGQEAIDILKKEKDNISIVLLDIIMPILDGKALLKIRQKDDDLKKIPFIVLTSDKEIEIECFELGASDYITKPFVVSPRVIQQRVKRIIELYEDRELIKNVNRDRLTGLFTRKFFIEFAHRLDRTHPDLSFDLIALNVSHFHLINEMFGRIYGDELLKDIGSHLFKYIENLNGIAGRGDADNFFVYVEHQDDYSPLLEELNRSINIGKLHNVRIYAGLYPNVDHDIEKEVVIDSATASAKLIKNDYNAFISIYDNAAHDKDLFKEELINSFEKAIKEEQFKVYYQPKYSIQGEKNVLASAEALVRWVHPKHGIISPGIFIPLFENNGLVRMLDDYILRTVAKQIHLWHEKYGIYMPVSVNISRVDIFNPNLENNIITYVDKYHIPHDKYLIEITESAYAENNKVVVNLVTSLREKGFKVEIDDFGTGYSSLGALADLPFDVLKIDMSFIRKIDADEKVNSIIKMIIELAKAMNAMTIAEGVETDRHYQFLKENGCDVIQGYYFSKPLPENEYEELMKKELL